MPVSPASRLRAKNRTISTGDRTWDTSLKRVRQPLGGKADWVEYVGTPVVKPMMGERANLLELDVGGDAGRIAGVSLRRYEPASGQWTMHFSNLANGLMTEPMHGVFRGGQASFYGQHTLNARAILVRFLILPVDASRWRFEQAYSADGGEHWEINWIAIDTRRPTSPKHGSRTGKQDESDRIHRCPLH